MLDKKLLFYVTIVAAMAWWLENGACDQVVSNSIS